MHDETIVPMGGTKNRFTSAVLEDGPHAGHYTAKLTIDKVTKEDKEKDNVLVVKNDLGETQYKFSLGVGERPPVGESRCKTRTSVQLSQFSHLIVPVKTTQSNLSPSAHSRLIFSLTYDRRLCNTGCMMRPQCRFLPSSGWKSMMARSI